MRKNNKNNKVKKRIAPKKIDITSYIKKNKVMISCVIVGLVFFSVAIFSPQTFSFKKQKVESSSFGGYQRPDKSSLNSSMPTRVIWHEPFFMDKKK